ncbi:hypothetical protein PVK06_046504 [Gossypium arboreum]|uniref:Uncharacterized protein n=1 Tax=Gossypium arboreum TaxID=29729 RepID=A0ABR0MAT5_GOSAR|nr:hypothetical protein PVK06_046504 [Gossypium arboreum]
MENTTLALYSGRYETSTRRDDVLPTTSTGEGTSYITDDNGLDDESDVDPPQEPGLDGAKVILFSKPEPVPSRPEDVKEGSYEEEDLRLRNIGYEINKDEMLRILCLVND